MEMADSGFRSRFPPLKGESMPYCLMDLRYLGNDEGWGPGFPPEVGGFMLLAEPGPNAGWALYEYSLETDAVWSPDEPIDEDLRVLIESGRTYPPALALARSRVERAFAKSSPTKQQFLIEFARALRTALAGASEARFVLAPAVVEEVGYLDFGEWHWILGFSSPAREHVLWVSDDFYIYTNPAEHFDLGDGRREQLRVLGGAKRADGG